MAIHVVQSQRLNVLLHALQQRSLNARQTPLQLLQPLHCIVPSIAVEQWLKQQLAQQQGISAHWQFHYGIRSFQWYAYQQVLPEKDRVRKANLPQLMMKWRIYQHLQAFFYPPESRLSEQNSTATESEHSPLQLHLDVAHPLYTLLQRVEHSASGLGAAPRFAKIHSMLYWLATQSASLFSHYTVYRSACQRNCAPPCNCPNNWLQLWGAGQHLPLTQLMGFAAANTSQASPNTAQSSSGSLAQPEHPQQQIEQIEAWQGYLWQTLFHSDWQETEKIDQQFWQALAQEPTKTQALGRLPQHLTVFTVSELAPSQLNFLRRLAQHIDILILHFNPSQEYWADTVDPNWKKQYDLGVKQRYLNSHPKASDAELAAFFQQFTLHFNAELRESRHPLLTRFGKQARDQFSLLANLAAGDEGQWVDAFVEDFPDTLLGRVQRDILFLNDVQENSHRLAPDDASIQVHVCHSALRQVEVLKDQLLAWLAADATRHPSDVVVLCPKLTQIEPFVRSVFGGDAKQKGFIPTKIAGVAPHDQMQAWQAIYTRMQLLQGRFQPQHLADWLSLPATMQRYGLDANRIERMMQLLSAAGFKRGFDAAHLQQSLDPHDQDYRFSFQFALNRLALGVVIPEHRVFADVLSFDGVNAGDFELIGTLMHIEQHLRERRNWLTPYCPATGVAAQLQRILSEIDEFMNAGVAHLQHVRDQAQKLWRMYGLATVNNQSNLAALKHLKLPLSHLMDELNAQLQTQFEQAAPTGYLTFAEIGQLRPLPYQVIVMLNLDNGTFPARQRHSAFDLMQLLRPQLGDRARLDDDQGAFLDALLLAQQELWLFYNGFDVADSEVREPSTVVQELLEHLAVMVVHPEDGAVTAQQHISLDGLSVAAKLQSLYRVHPLQPFDASGFQAPHTRYPDAWSVVAKQLLHATGQRVSPFAMPVQSGATAQPNEANEPSAQPLQLLDAAQWMADMAFPARVYLKQFGIRNIAAQSSYADQEALLLDGLGRHGLRDQLLKKALNSATSDLTQPDQVLDLALLQDQLPIGKMQHAAVQRAQHELQSLLTRMQPFAAMPSATTQHTWFYAPDLAFNLSVPHQHATNAPLNDWVSVQASAARGRRKVLVWLEYLMWVLWMAQQQPHIATPSLRRVAVFNDDIIICQGITREQAASTFDAWLTAWRYAQQQVLVLPAELLMQLAKPNEMPDWLEVDGQYQPQNMPALLKTWCNSYNSAGIDLREQEQSRLHRDWRFLLQHQPDELLLTEACNRFAYALYQPIFQYLEVQSA